MNRKFSNFIFVVLFSACSGVKMEKYAIESASNKCMDFLEKDISTRNIQVHKDIINSSGTLLSYSLTGIGYIGDFTLFLSNGVVMPLFFCSPVIYIGGATRNDSVFGDMVVQCWKMVSRYTYDKIVNLMGGKFSTTIYENTNSLRCPDITWLKDSLERVATCYKDSGELEKFNEQMAIIENDEYINSCNNQN